MKPDCGCQIISVADTTPSGAIRITIRRITDAKIKTRGFHYTLCLKKSTFFRGYIAVWRR